MLVDYIGIGEAHLDRMLVILDGINKRGHS